MKIRAQHTTRYTYEGAVSHCHSEARLTPRLLPHQQLLDWRLEVHPAPSAIISRKDYFGNDVSSFAVLESHHQFEITATSLIEISPLPDLLGPGPTCADLRDLLQAANSPATLAANEFLWESPFVPYLDELHAYAAPILAPGRPLREAAEELMRKIFQDYTYKPASTSIETPLQKVVAMRQGVCQDYSHVMIGALRAHGLAARYVSGYLRSDANFVGAQASHAWVSVYLGDFGWVDFDPTNNRLPSTGHITIAWGRDFGDVTPVKGITIGGGKHTLEVEVHVTPA
jgi:transglutaminase-like putative cysteine protease